MHIGGGSISLVIVSQVHEPCDWKETNQEEIVKRDRDAGMVEIDDERLNQVYNELLIQKFNLDAEDFKDDAKDVHSVVGE